MVVRLKARPRIYDLRSTFATDALAAGVSEFLLARYMGTSGRMIELHYGALADGSGAEVRADSTRWTANAFARETSPPKGDSQPWRTNRLRLGDQVREG